MRTTLECHVLAAWQLKLPLWPSDLLHVASTGELPYLAFAADTRGMLSAAGERIVPGFLETPALCAELTLVRRSQQAAHSMGLVLPELNLGAQPCATVGECLHGSARVAARVADAHRAA